LIQDHSEVIAAHCRPGVIGALYLLAKGQLSVCGCF
jgi:hypothetical protein